MINTARNIVGIIPAAGKSLRFGSLCKELLPVISNDNRLIVSADCTVDSMVAGGANNICIVINEQKQEVIKYFSKSELINHMAFFVQMGKEGLRGLPVALDIPYDFVKNDTVFFGMPDTICMPRNYFTEMRTVFDSEKLELVLGIFPIEDSTQVGPVKIGDNDQIIKIYDKNPEITIHNTWGAAIWGPEFTEILHEFVVENKKQLVKGEIILKSVFELAIKNNLNAKSCFFERGAYYDLADFKKYKNMLNELNR